VAVGRTKGARMSGWRKRQVLELALEALEAAEIEGNCEYGATEIIRKALAQPEQEPVAWMWTFKSAVGFSQAHILGGAGYMVTPLYTQPPKREWVGLTDEEVSKLIDQEIGFNSCWGPEEAFAQAIEAKLKEKNT